MQIFHHGVLVTRHIAKPWGEQTDPNAYPPEKIDYARSVSTDPDVLAGAVTR